MLTVLKGRKTVFFWKNSLLEIIPTYTRNAVLTCVQKIFPHKAASFSLNVQKRSKKSFIPKKLLIVKLFCRHAACSFNNPTERSSKKRWKIFLKCPKRDEKFFKKRICSKFPYWHVECSFENSNDFFLAEGRKFTAECPKKSERFFSKNYFVKMFLLKKTIFNKMIFWTVRIVLTNPPEFFRQKAETSLLTVLKWWIFFQGKQENYFPSKWSVNT